MRYDLSNKETAQKAKERFHKLMEQGKNIELKVIHPNRTIKQNSYVHLLFSLYGLEFGYTIDEVKQYIKYILGYTYEKNGGQFYKSTAKMDTKELTEFIDKFRNYSSTQGCYLPQPNEVNNEMLNYIEQNKEYLTGKFY